jgi:uncharacterized membrane protein
VHPMTAAILVALSATTALYAFVLERLNERYVPNWTWLTVVIGNALIGGALWAVERWSEPLTFGVYLFANIAAGGPIIGWQLWQNERRRRERAR